MSLYRFCEVCLTSRGRTEGVLAVGTAHFTLVMLHVPEWRFEAGKGTTEGQDMIQA